MWGEGKSHYRLCDLFCSRLTLLSLLTFIQIIWCRSCTTAIYQLASIHLLPNLGESLWHQWCHLAQAPAQTPDQDKAGTGAAFEANTAYLFIKHSKKKWRLLRYLWAQAHHPSWCCTSSLEFTSENKHELAIDSFKISLCSCLPGLQHKPW